LPHIPCGPGGGGVGTVVSAWNVKDVAAKVLLSVGSEIQEAWRGRTKIWHSVLQTRVANCIISDLNLNLQVTTTTPTKRITKVTNQVRDSNNRATNN
jgi:hypothetical protein